MAVILENITDPIVLQDVTPPIAYLTAVEFRTMAAGMMAVPGIAAMLAMNDDAIAAVLFAASHDIDAAMHYQGRKYFGTQQPLEFPRVAFGSTPGVNQFGIPLSGPTSLPLTMDTVVWDWDIDPSENGSGIGGGKAVVPYNVKLACIYQAAWLQQPKYAQRLEDIQSGVTSHSIGTASESFVKAADISAAGFTGLGNRAMRLMEKYRIGTGRLL